MTAPCRAPAPPLRLRLRSATAARRPISYETKDRKPDGGWGHFKPSPWGQCKSSRRLEAENDHLRGLGPADDARAATLKRH
jgi:hypothetical protein